MTQDRDLHIAGYKVAPETASGALHFGANFIPSPLLGSVVDFAASSMDVETNQLHFVQTWKSAIARHLKMHEADLEGDNGVAIVETHLGKLPPALRAEWEKIQDLEGKTSDFLVSGFAQIGGTALVGMVLGGVLFPPMGMILGLVGGGAAGYAASKIFKDARGDADELAASEVIPAIHHTAMQLQKEHGNNQAVPIDTTLLGAYLIAAHSGKGGVLEGYNSEDLKRMFQEHMSAKAENPHVRTELDDYIQGLNRAEDNPFALLLPDNVDPAKIKGASVLHTIAMNMHSQHDLEDWLFDPARVQQTLASQHAQHPSSVNHEHLAHAGRSLHQAMEVPVHEHGLPVHKGHGSGQHL